MLQSSLTLCLSQGNEEDGRGREHLIYPSSAISSPPIGNARKQVGQPRVALIVVFAVSPLVALAPAWLPTSSSYRSLRFALKVSLSSSMANIPIYNVDTTSLRLALPPRMKYKIISITQEPVPQPLHQQSKEIIMKADMTHGRTIRLKLLSTVRIL